MLATHPFPSSLDCTVGGTVAELVYPSGYATAVNRNNDEDDRGFRTWSQEQADKNFEQAITATMIGFVVIIIGLVHAYQNTVPTPEPNRQTGPKRQVSFVKAK